MKLDRLLSWVDAHTMALLWAVLLLRSVFLLTNGLNLIGDESYYWDWSRQPDWCYYSKPPMIAWLIGASTWLLGDHGFAVRLPAVLLGTLFLGYLHATAKAFYGQRAAALALLLILATPINVLANLLMTIDAPLYLFWIISLYYLHKALFQAEPRAWLWAGCASAAALLSKQVALILPLSLGIYLLTTPSLRSYLRWAYGWYLLPIALAAIPILWWNHQHDWVMFGHSKGHFTEDSAVTLPQRLKHSLDFLLYQLLLLSPLTAVLLICSSLQGAWQLPRHTPAQRFLWLMGPVWVLGVLLLSLLQKVQGNWPMPFYFSAIMLLVGQWSVGQWQKTIKYALMLGALLVMLTYGLPLLIQASPWKDSALDPTKRFKNWQELAINVHFERLIALPKLENTFVVALGHRYLASQLAFYLPDHPQVYRYETSGQITSQYEVWPGPEHYVGQNALIIGETPEGEIPATLKNAFEKFVFWAQIANPDKPQSPYYAYLGINLQTWPNLHQR